LKSTDRVKYSVVDLFAGAGGLSCGFLQSGRFEIKAAFENNPNAKMTYKKNHKGTDMYDDVTEALSAQLGKIDVVIGGPPCQGFSNANRQKNHAVSQNNSLLKKFVQVVLHLNPTAFVMENVSMLQSNIHRFYVDESDSETIEKYNIKTELTDIHLLNTEYVFEGVADSVADIDTINRYCWADERDYLILNVVYKTRKNSKKLKATLEKHKRKLLILAERLTTQQADNDPIIVHDTNTGNAIKHYFSNDNITKESEFLCDAIEPTIMLQRMFSKAKEIHENKIIVSGYSTERGLTAKVQSMAVIDYIESILGAPDNGYMITKGVLSAVTFGTPQKRMRFVVIGVKRYIADSIALPIGIFSEQNYRTVEDAIKDIENVPTSDRIADGDNGVMLSTLPEKISELGQQLRDSSILFNHVSTTTSEEAMRRFKSIKPGDNFHSLDEDLKSSYSDPKRTQNTIYLRLNYEEPSGTVINVRKSMWIHPVLNRAISIREAARLQTFPDSFVFYGTKDSQYQQVGNAVPPMLAKAIATHLCEYLDAEKAVISYLKKHVRAKTADFAIAIGRDR
jgi:DNA (cytosine-5)-methyltransferase 1